MYTRRPILLIIALAVLAVAVALPVVAADPADPSPSPGASAKPGKARKEKVPEVPVTLTGQVAATTDADGKTVYTLTAGGTTYTLDAGPAWFHGDNHPLKGLVGQTVTIEGGKAADSDEVDVEKVDGKAIRAAGKPPWAGGWKRVGKAHPGWSQEKADRFKAKFGDCFPPGQCKVKPNRGGAAASPAPSAGPD